jgi:two-component system, NtrC family, response regulator PilR
MLRGARRILIVDDEPSMRDMLSIMLAREGYDVLVADSRAAAARVLAGAPLDAVITDVKLPDGDGVEILRHVKAGSPETAVIVMTAFGSTQTAVAAMKLGAHDYLVKPFDVDELKIVLRNALEREELREENRLLKAEFRTRHGLERILGVSRAMVPVFDMIRSVGATSTTVLITGESGTGKELVAKAIHAQSARSEGPFVSVSCAAVAETLLESELFGHVKGAFTDAHQNKKGLFEAAHRGTIFLDEVGETPAPMQAKLLRALQEKRIRRVGGTDEIDVDVRVIAATNRSLEAMVREKRFREDLFYRLNVIPIHLPPLRQRQEDIPLLAEHFLERFATEMGKPLRRISQQAMERLLAWAWPGNVRELENVLERAVALETTEAILVERLPETVRRGAPGADAPPSPALGHGFNLDLHLAGIEEELVRDALEQSGGDRAAACQLLGVTPRSLRYLIAKHGLTQSGAGPKIGR